MLGGRNPGLGLAILRVAVGLIFVMHGWPKLAGGIEGTAAFLGSLGVPLSAIGAWGIALAETLGGACLIAGLFVTPFALLLAAHMLAGIFLVHLANGFYVVGPGQGGYEFNLLLIAALLTLVLAGSGIATLKSLFTSDVEVVID
ncbi:MAG: DoxX family protein [Gemmatimonadales bacterium]|uniref:DoxX family protein n=1 Tax=Candidatus Palauibacter irciniicola TaxID=3056733 RepID=UPI001384AD5B|nr:DoxX family protein [Candidatus Palauibacter irciniicola]MYC17315.1 DoxX family protein [Gemmatimonadales bacterium]